MSANQGTNISAPVVPNDSNDVFASHIAKYGHHGYRAVDTLAERDAITLERRGDMMWVSVLQDRKTYELALGTTSNDLLDNGNWVELSLGGTVQDSLTPASATVAPSVDAVVTALDAKAEQSYVDNADSNLQNQIYTLYSPYENGTNTGAVQKKGSDNHATNYQSAVVAGESSYATGGYTMVAGGYLNAAVGNWATVIGGRNNTNGSAGLEAYGIIIGSSYCYSNAEYCGIYNSHNCTIAAGCNNTTLIGCINLNITSGSNQTYVNNVLYVPGGGGSNYVALTGDQTISGNKIFTDTLAVTNSTNTGAIVATSTSGSNSISVGSFLAPNGTQDIYFSVGKNLNLGQAALIGISNGRAFMTVFGRPASDFSLGADGSIGIGTNTPGERLDVAGKVKATHFVGDGSLLTNLPTFRYTTGTGAGSIVATVKTGATANTASGDSSVVGGGFNNVSSNDQTTVAGGANNIASGLYAAIGGGNTNTAEAQSATIPGGQGNHILGTGAYYGTISGGLDNYLYSPLSVIGGGRNNNMSASDATIAGGRGNNIPAGGTNATIGGGVQNQAAGNAATVSGGQLNKANAQWAWVSGGYNNNVTGNGASASGKNNTVQANDSHIYGSQGCTIGAGCVRVTLINCNGLNIQSGTDQTYVNNQLVVPGFSNPTSSNIVFNLNAEYTELPSGTFTVDTSTKVVGSVVSVYLATGATIPTLSSEFILPPSGGAYVAGKPHMLVFKVAGNGKIIYTITPLS